MGTKISWTEATWNPVTGCSHVSEGCRNCYAERLSLRYKRSLKPWTAQNAAENVVLHPERLDAPLHWKSPRRVFVNSMSDLFHELVPDEFISHVFEKMWITPWHTYQILTKRPARMLEFMRKFAPDSTDPDLLTFDENEVAHYFGDVKDFPLKNVWLGVSCEDQKTADERIPLLLQTPAAVRFLSCEPLLGPIDLESVCFSTRRGSLTNCIDWVICGGESGPNFRPMEEEWARSIRDQCVSAGVPFFFKQHSAYRSETNPLLDGVEWHQYPGN